MRLPKFWMVAYGSPPSVLPDISSTVWTGEMGNRCSGTWVTRFTLTLRGVEIDCLDAVGTETDVDFVVFVVFANGDFVPAEGLGQMQGLALIAQLALLPDCQDSFAF